MRGDPDDRVRLPCPELIGIESPLQSVEVRHPQRRGRSLSDAEILLADGIHRPTESARLVLIIGQLGEVELERVC